MKNKIFFILAILPFLGCEKSNLMLYNGGESIYFNYPFATKTIGTYDRQIVVAFGKSVTASDYDVTFDVKALGNFQNRKRTFKLVTDTEHATAREGVNFLLPPVDSFYIAASSFSKQLNIKVLRPASLRDTLAYFDLKLVDNENFNTALNIPAGTGQLQSTTIRIIVDDRLVKPKIWDASVGFLGKWSREKLEKMVQVLPANMDLFYSEAPYTAGQLATLSRNMQLYLNNQKSIGNTILEKDGSEMKMGANAQ